MAFRVSIAVSALLDKGVSLTYHNEDSIQLGGFRDCLGFRGLGFRA